MFTIFRDKYPEQVFGYLGRAKTAIAVDADTTKGSAIPAVTDYIKWMEQKDKAKYKNTIIQNYGYIVYIHANVNKDYQAALATLNEILLIDPENAYAKATSEAIKKIMQKGGGNNRPGGPSKGSGKK